MDEKTEDLRDIFLDVTEEETVTESQARGRGTLTGSGGDVDERLAAVVARLRDRFDFRTDLSAETYGGIVRGFYDGRDDDALADDLGLDAETVFRARADLHLVSEDDADVDLDALGDVLDPDAGVGDIATAAEALETSENAVRRATIVLAAQRASRRVSHRFRSEFEDALPNADLSAHLTAEANEDGLGEATEDAEVDTDF